MRTTFPAILVLLLAGASPALHAQSFDCSAARDPQGCESRMAKMREARDKARNACEGKSGDERRSCMEKNFCAGLDDPARCEKELKERIAQGRRMRAACKDKKGDERAACLKEQRGAANPQPVR